MALPQNFYLPPSARIQGDEPKFRCRLCDEPFWDRDQFGRHMKNCADQREDEMREHSARHQAPFLFDDQNEGDVEFREYVRRTGNWH